MRKDFLAGKPFEVVHRAFELRRSGFKDREIAWAVFEEAFAAYRDWAKRNASPDFAVPFFARDLAAGLLYLETGSYVEEAEDEESEIERLRAEVKALREEIAKRLPEARPSNPDAWDLFPASERDS